MFVLYFKKSATLKILLCSLLRLLLKSMDSVSNQYEFDNFWGNL